MPADLRVNALNASSSRVSHSGNGGNVASAQLHLANASALNSDGSDNVAVFGQLILNGISFRYSATFTSKANPDCAITWYSGSAVVGDGNVDLPFVLVTASCNSSSALLRREQQRFSGTSIQFTCGLN